MNPLTKDQETRVIEVMNPLRTPAERKLAQMALDLAWGSLNYKQNQQQHIQQILSILGI